MKPAAVDYVRARSLAEALQLLARPNVDARVMRVASRSSR